MNELVYILAIESSCDDTAAAVLRSNTVLSNVIASQKVHKEYGGVVPELASRAHQQNIIPVVDTALKKAGINTEELNAIAFTKGPGLMGSLLVGNSFAKGTSLALGIPLIEVHHMQAHVLAHFIKEQDGSGSSPNFPFLCLTVSGGHTQIVRVDSPYRMEIMGQTLDDAAGEAFDKIAKMMGLPYPGGPLVDKYGKEGNANRFSFTHPSIEEFNYSFSGLKTGFLYFVRDEINKDPDFIKNNLNDLAASVQKTIVDILLDKLIKASEATGIQEVAIAGGVSANSRLRDVLKKVGMEKNWETYIPPFEYCTDNAAMIGICGYFKFLKGEFSTQRSTPAARLNFSD